MGKKIKEIDEYIARSAPFARPILKKMRELVHQVCPDTEEKMKWSFPHFDYKNEMMCHMAAFKQHCAFGFWKAPLMKDKALHDMAQTEQAMGHLGKISCLEDLPSDKKLSDYIKEAMMLNEKGIKLPPKNKKPADAEISIPDYFLKALKKNKNAWLFFESASYSFRKEYIQWLEEAKTQETREKRMTTAVEWIAEKKGRNWKYVKK